jgi:phage RecT family recombinase
VTIQRTPTKKNAVATQNQAAAPARPNAAQADPVVARFRAEVRERQTNVAGLLGCDKDSPTAIRYIAQFVRLVSANPKLLDQRPATRQSLMLAFGEVAALGLSLNPQEGQAYLIPRWNTKQGCNIVDLQLGYRGMQQLAYRSGLVETIGGTAVYKGEHYVRRGGTIDPGIEHIPDDLGDKRTGKMVDILCAYATARLHGATRDIAAVVNKRQIEDARSRSGGSNGTSPVWAEHPEAMVVKTAIRRLCKHLPMSDGLAALHGAVAREAEREAGLTVFAAAARSVALPRAQPMAGLDALTADPYDVVDPLDTVSYDLGREGQGGESADQADDQNEAPNEALAEGAQAFDEIEGPE